MSIADWTVMIYMAGDNGRILTGMEGAGYDDLAEMKRVGSSDRLHILAQFDTLSDKTTRRFRLRRGTPLAQDIIPPILPETNTGDPRFLEDFVAWGMSQYPAQHTLLVLWNHGNGWDDEDIYQISRAARVPTTYVSRDDSRAIATQGGGRKALFRSTLIAMPETAAAGGDRGILYDDTAVDFLDNNELKAVLASITARRKGVKLDILGMDACLMSMVEIAYQVRDGCSLCVGSEEAEPMAGWPYHTILGELMKSPALAPSQLARVIVEKFIASYDRGYFSENATQAALDVGQIEAVGQAVDRLAGVLLDHIGDMELLVAVDAAQGAAQKFRRDEDYVDLVDFCGKLQAGAQAQADVAAVAGAIVSLLTPGEGRPVLAAKTVGSGVKAAKGLSIFFPPRGCDPASGIGQLYKTLDFSAKYRWDDFLFRFYAKTHPA
ncbi:MAG: clostripain-related cysteine peptidase [Chloroflexi bacterium]|nr:clostripain-related cysteine peptidase [Chloroflexota bacterium]